MRKRGREGRWGKSERKRERGLREREKHIHQCPTRIISVILRERRKKASEARLDGEREGVRGVVSNRATL